MKQAAEAWVVGALVLTQDSRRRLLRADVRVVDGRIAAISRRAATGSGRRPARGARVIDASGLTLVPGFVQAHVHLCQTLFRNQADDLSLLDWLAKRVWKLEAAHTAETLSASAWLGIHELLTSGTTCALDMGTVRHTGAILEAVQASGLRASVGKCLMDDPRGAPASLREPADAALAEATDLYDRWHGTEDDRIRISFAPRFAVSCTDGLLREVARLSCERGALVHTHASENQDEIRIVRRRAGCGNVEYLRRVGLLSPRTVLAHCVWLSPAERRALAREGAHVAHCPSSNLKLASGFAPVPELRALGVNVALGADGAPCNNNLSMLTEMRLAALIHKPGRGPKTVRAQEALDMATRAGARALGWWDDIGSIEVGKRADFAAFDLGALENGVSEDAVRRLDADAHASALVYSTSAAHLRWTMVDGRVVARGGRLAAMAPAELGRRVHAARAAIARRAGI